MKKLIKSYRFWTALAGALGLLVVNIAKLFGYSMSSVVVEELIMAICGVLVVFGIVSKPEDVVKTETTSNSNEKQETDTTQTQEEAIVTEQEKTTKKED